MFVKALWFAQRRAWDQDLGRLEALGFTGGWVKKRSKKKNQKRKKQQKKKKKKKQKNMEGEQDEAGVLGRLWMVGISSRRIGVTLMMRVLRQDIPYPCGSLPVCAQ